MKDLKGSILMFRGDLDSAETFARQNLEKSFERGYKKNVGKAERLWGLALCRRGAFDRAEVKLKEALLKLKAVGNTKQIWMTHTALAQLYSEMKRPDLEREQWQAAGGEIEAVADDIKDQRLREVFLRAEPVKEIIERATL